MKKQAILAIALLVSFSAFSQKTHRVMGWKYLTRNNWVGEFYFGAGRDFVNDGAYPRLGISIGKRF